MHNQRKENQTRPNQIESLKEAGKTLVANCIVMGGNHGSLSISMTQSLTLTKHFMENLWYTISYMRRFM